LTVIMVWFYINLLWIDNMSFSNQINRGNQFINMLYFDRSEMKEYSRTFLKKLPFYIENPQTNVYDGVDYSRSCYNTIRIGYKMDLIIFILHSTETTFMILHYQDYITETLSHLKIY